MWEDVPPSPMGSELEASVPYLSEQQSAWWVQKDRRVRQPTRKHRAVSKRRELPCCEPQQSCDVCLELEPFWTCVGWGLRGGGGLCFSRDWW